MPKKNIKKAYLEGEWLSEKDFFRIHNTKNKYHNILDINELYLIPLPLVAEEIGHIPPVIKDIIPKIKLYFVENIRTARRYISSLKLGINIQELTFYEFNNKTKQKEIYKYCEIISKNKRVGIMSENGLPAIADPGTHLISYAHSIKARVIPLTGPSSIFLALMSSGLNGQKFHFNGYLTIKSDKRQTEIKKYLSICQKSMATQIFIETPYRNQSLYEDLIKTLPNNIYLCIAQNITGKTEKIQTKSVSNWKKTKKKLDKIPCIFMFNYL